MNQISIMVAIAITWWLSPSAQATPPKVKAAATTAQLKPVGQITPQPFQWNRQLRVGQTFEESVARSVIGVTYGGKHITRATQGYMRCRINDKHEGADQYHSDMYQLFLWSSKSGPQFKGEPLVVWAASDMKGLEGLGNAFSSATGDAKMISDWIPYWDIHQDGTYQPGQTFMLNAPEGLTETRHTRVVYKGLQSVGKYKCGYFEYTITTSDPGGNKQDQNIVGQLWIDSSDGIYRLSRRVHKYDFQLDSASGEATETEMISRI